MQVRGVTSRSPVGEVTEEIQLVADLCSAEVHALNREMFSVVSEATCELV